MASFDFKVLLLWFDNSVQILQWVAVVLLVARVSVRVKWLKKAIRGAETNWRYAMIAICFFGLLAILGNHSRLMMDTNECDQLMLDTNKDSQLMIKQLLSSMKWPEGKPSISLREVMVLVAGLSAGPWVGLGTGLIAGYERFFVGDDMALKSGVTTPLLGLLAGLVMRYCPRCALNYGGVLLIALAATWLKFLIVYQLSTIETEHNLVWASVAPASMVNTIGCLLFLSVIQDLKRERLEQSLQLAELRTLKAQLEPHFIPRALIKVCALIGDDSEKAKDSLILIRDFCRQIRKFIEFNTISLHQEMTQLQRYLDIQTLSLGHKLQTTFSVPEHLFEIPVLPGCMLTFVENAIHHGSIKGLERPYILAICAEDHGDELILSVSDNGVGISLDRQLNLGKAQVESADGGSGVALYQLAQCLSLVYGDNAKINFEPNMPNGTKAVLTQPKRVK